MNSWMRASMLACALQFAFAPAALAQNAAPAGGEVEGRARFSRGIELYKENNFHAALAEFRAAYAAAPSWRIQFNLGQTLYQLQDYAGALTAFERYLHEGADKLEPARKTEVEGEVAKLRQRVATVIVSVPRPAGPGSTAPAEVLVDDEVKGSVTEQLEIVVSAGRRKFSASAPGYRATTRVLDVAGSTRVALQLPLEPLSAPAPVAVRPAAAPPPPPPKAKSRLPFWLGLTATGLAAGGAVTFGFLAKREHDKYQEELGIPNIAAQSLQNTRDATRQNALVADILGATTIALAGFTVVAFVLTSGNQSPPKQAKLQPLLGPGALGLRGRF